MTKNESDKPKTGPLSTLRRKETDQNRILSRQLLFLGPLATMQKISSSSTAASRPFRGAVAARRLNAMHALNAGFLNTGKETALSSINQQQQVPVQQSSQIKGFSDLFSVGRCSEYSDFNLPHDDLRNLAKNLPEFCLNSRADNTTRKYRYAFDRFCRWCTNYHINPLTASDFNVSLYLIHVRKKSNSVAKVDKAFYAISWSHKLAGYADPCNSFLCTAVKEGA